MGIDLEYHVFHGYQTCFADNMSGYRTSVMCFTGLSDNNTVGAGNN